MTARRAALKPVRGPKTSDGSMPSPLHQNKAPGAPGKPDPGRSRRHRKATLRQIPPPQFSSLYADHKRPVDRRGHIGVFSRPTPQSSMNSSSRIVQSLDIASASKRAQKVRCSRLTNQGFSAGAGSFPYNRAQYLTLRWLPPAPGQYVLLSCWVTSGLSWLDVQDRVELPGPSCAPDDPSHSDPATGRSASIPPQCP